MVLHYRKPNLMISLALSVGNNVNKKLLWEAYMCTYLIGKNHFFPIRELKCSNCLIFKLFSQNIGKNYCGKFRIILSQVHGIQKM